MLAELLTAAALVGGAPFSGLPVASIVPGSFRAEVRSSAGDESIAWQLPERFRVDPAKPDVPGFVERDGTRFDGAVGEFDGLITRRTFPARPDGYSLALQWLPQVEDILARARAGGAIVQVALDGAPALKASYRLPANECAALPAGTGEVWLDPATLLPLREVERRAGRTRIVRITYRDLNAPLGSADFVPPVLDLRPGKDDQRFRRAAPEVAAASLSYAPQLPGLLPSGFALAVSGWAPQSGITGGEGSIAPFKELFAAVYRRGFERIDLTQRLARGGGWPDDPFGIECVPITFEKVRVQGQPARFGSGVGVVPHLYWRKGRVLYTLAGPLPKDDLVAIADSLAPVTAAAPVAPAAAPASVP